MGVTSKAQPGRTLVPGTRLGKYDLIRQIAVGGMAELFLARTTGIEGFEKLVVVKRILPQYANSASFIEMFLDEARLAATLHHPNIAQVYDIGVEQGDYFFAMEYVHGEDVGRLVATATEQGVPISVDVALTLIVGVAAGLHYAHEKAGADGKPLGIVHRDVSPSNVLVSYEGSVKVVDFGIARATSRQTTQTGGIKGKIGYMSPEQCRGSGALDRRSDIFSIGTLLYELTTGTQPFAVDTETEFATLDKIVNSDVEPPTRRVPDYPPSLERIVMRAMNRDVSRRYATALALQGDLEDFAHDNRLRISTLTLARLMSTLFPARLEEWEKARAQGAYFVEQHVVKTLVTSGRTTDYSTVVDRENALLEDTVTSAGPTMPSDDDRTDVVVPLPVIKVPAVIPPIVPPPKVATPVPLFAPAPAIDHAPAPKPRPMTPVPQMAHHHPTPQALPPPPIALHPPTPPGVVPIVAPPILPSGSIPTPAPRMMTPAPVAPIAPRQMTPIPAPVPVPIDDMFTERVTPTPIPAPAAVLEARRGRGLFTAVAALVVVGAVVAAFIAFQSGDDLDLQSTPTTPPPTTPTPPPSPPSVPSVAPIDVAVPQPPADREPEPVAEPTPPTPLTKIVETDETDETDDPPSKASKSRRTKSKASRSRRTKTTKTKTSKRSDPKPDDKPKEKPWSDDSPFMPVRPDSK